MTYFANVPALHSDSGLSAYIAEINKFPMLKPEQEQALALRWRDNDDIKAAQTLVTSHLRLVVKIALGYRGYGLPMSDIIAEGNLGLMQSIRKFDPDKGFRLSTYAMWWIKAAIQEYILHTWSLVKIGTTAAQKKLFFNLRRLKNKLYGTDTDSATTATIAQTLDVTEQDVRDMQQRLRGGGDQSLNVAIYHEGSPREWLDTLEDGNASPEETAVERDEQTKRQRALHQALDELNPREKDIFIARRLADPIATLEDLSLRYNISRERVRQIENRAFEKVQLSLTN